MNIINQKLVSLFAVLGMTLACDTGEGFNGAGKALKGIGINNEDSASGGNVDKRKKLKRQNRDGADAIGESGETDAGEANGESGGEDDEDGLGSDGGDDEDSAPMPQKKQKPETLMWKRYRPFENALMSGLALPKSDVCTEIGRASCVDEIHLSVLGGNEPYVNGQYERAATPTILTSVAVERIVLSACDKRLTLDKGLGTGAVVFKYWASTDAQLTDDKVKAQTQELYRRLLARDANDNELGAALEVLKIVQTPDKVALALCFAVGTQAENVFL